ncbi:uncharacterized protein LOC100904422 [Galendromus occidentalis]|uniref:Uncharacterized protein LOC100904422 n=1 Tax=Galendromus occidentalis TaxID=34638 RepID=A0AAJ6QUB4_9ACAR|nr:uncharacterized protein LOC100904422 [Galendromus occidentalis]
MRLELIFIVSVVTAQKLGKQTGGIQNLQSVPLPPRGYVSPSSLRQQQEPPKPFSYKYEGPDPYGGFSSHESQGDENGRITGQYTVENPDGTSRLVKYVADPELGFFAEVETDEEGTKTSEPANVSIVSTAPEETYQPQPKTNDYSDGRRRAPYARNSGRFSQNKKSPYNTARAPAASASSAYRASTRRPAFGVDRGLRQQPRNFNAPLANYRNYQQGRPDSRSASPNTVFNQQRRGLYQQRRDYSAPRATYNSVQRQSPQAFRGYSPNSSFNQQTTFNNPSLNYNYNVNSPNRGTNPGFGTRRPYTASRPQNSNPFRPNAYRDELANQNRITG